MIYSQNLFYICMQYVCVFVSKENLIFILLKSCIICHAGFIPLAKFTSTLN